MSNLRVRWGLGVAGPLLLFAGIAAGKSSTNACALVSRASIERVMGEPVKDVKPTSQIHGEVLFAQCFYTLRTFTNSISVTVTAPGPADVHLDAARELWQRWFHRGEGEKEHEHEHDADRGGESEEEEAAAKAVPVPGIGEEAFWVHSFVGTLYVRKGDQFIRISMGGKLSDDERLAKAKALASDALRHMP
ncbi:MAG: hypothetical protein JO091_05970 [Acidobacteriaceae bacterium]|nr:hypothetical protein [Acidobacteriaceae bacterium]